MEDIEYTICVPFVTAASEVEDRESRLSSERTSWIACPSPWVMQEEGEA